MLNLLIYIEEGYRNFKFRCKGRYFKLYLSFHGCKVGKGIKCIAIPKFKVTPNKNIEIGNNVTFGRNVTLEIGHEGKLVLGNNVLLADNVLLSTLSTITIKDWSAIAENVSVRGSFHEMRKDKPYRLQGNESLPIVLEEDTGIGAGSVVLMGVTISKGVYIAANSTVLKSTKMVPYGIYGGTPLKILKTRE